MISLLVVLCVAVPQEIQDKGAVEIRCDAGIEVFLDGVSKGKTGVEPMLLTDVPVGDHVIKLVKEGHEPQEIAFKVEAGRTASPTVGEFKSLPGEIVLNVDAGIEVFLDGDSKGTTRSEPFAIKNVAAGKHKIKLTKDGYLPQELEIVLDPGKTATRDVEPLKPDVKTSEYDEEPPYSLKETTGWLVVKSLPVSCTVSCEPLGLNKAEKTRERWSAFGIPPGKYAFRFALGGKTVELEVEFKAGTKVFSMVYLDQGKVTVNLGEIQIRCDPGIEISVDGESKGTSIQDGLLVRDVEPGRRTLTIQKFGFKPVEETATVEIGATSEVRVSGYNFKPEILIFEDGKEPDSSVKEKLWKLVVRSIPVECTVDCYDLELKKASKTKERWVAFGAVEGRFSLTFASGSDSVYCDVKPAVGKTTVLMVYFKDRRVETDKGDVHVKAEPGVSVFVDDADKGKTSEAEEGLVVRDLTPGKHAVKAVKPDFHPQEIEATVEAGEAALCSCKPFRPILQITETDDPPDPKFAGKSTLFLQTQPAECTVDCEPLGLEQSKKSKETWIAYGIPEGSYELTFVSGGKKVPFSAQFRAGRRVRIGIDFAAGKATLLPPTAADFELVSDQAAHSGVVEVVQCSPDGRLAVSAGKDWMLKIWDVAALKEFDTFPATDEARDLCFGPDGKWIAALHRDRTAIWEIARRKPAKVIPFLQDEWYTTILCTQNEIVIGGVKGSSRFMVKVVQISTGEEIRAIPMVDMVDAMALNPDGKTLTVGLHDNKLHLYNLADGKEGRKFLSSHKDWIRAVAWAPDGKRLASGSADKTVKIWDPVTGKAVKTLTGPDRVSSIAWSTDGKNLATGDEGGNVLLWDASTGKIAKRFAYHKGEVKAVSYGVDGKTVISGGADYHVRIFRMLE